MLTKTTYALVLAALTCLGANSFAGLPTVTSFSLVNATTGAVIDSNITDGYQIKLQNLSTQNINIVANTYSETKSMYIVLYNTISGQTTTVTENKGTNPFTLCTPSNAACAAISSAVTEITKFDLSATAYSETGRGGTPGNTLKISFTVVPPSITVQYFGLTHHIFRFTDKTFSSSGDPYPNVAFGSVRLWDTYTSWEALEGKARGTFDWTNLDWWFTVNNNYGGTNATEILYTMGGTPEWAASDTSIKNCHVQSPGSCSPPCDLSGTCTSVKSSSTTVCADGSTGNCLFKEYVTALVTRSCLAKIGDASSGSRCPSQPGRIKYYEIWNEANLGATTGDPEWTGSYSQLVSMAKDAKAIINKLDPSAKIVAPSASGGGTLTWLPTYLASYDLDHLGTGNDYADIVAFHGYPALTNSKVYAEGIVSEIATLKTKTTHPLFDTEASWGANSLSGATAPNITDGPGQQAFLAKYYLLHYSSGVSHFYWYAWEGGNWGGLWTTSGELPGAQAYSEVGNWLIGANVAPCTSVHNATTETNIWSCPITRANGYQGTIVWYALTSSSPAGTAVTTNYEPRAGTVKQYRNLAGTITPYSTGNVPIGNSPILFEN